MKKPIETLQENASNFFDKVFSKNSAQMSCSTGCSKCCYTDISIFDVEADLIRDYFKGLGVTQKEDLKRLWTSKNNEGACSFLYEEKCSIYSARPIICRTQGVPLHLSTENVLDYCPLNFKDGNPDKNDWLNLERLNTMLSFAANSAGRENRIRLKKLKIELLKS